MIRKSVLAALALLAGCQQAGQDAPETKLALTVEPQGSAPVQRITLPAAALVAVRRADLADLRVLDRRDKPLALAIAPIETPADSASTAFTPYPIAGTAAAGEPGAPAVSIELARPGQTVSITTDGTPLGPSRAAVLLDTRALKDPAIAIDLGASLPAQVPVTFALDTSADLKTWQPLAEKVLFAPNGGNSPLGKAEVDLGGTALAGQFLRITWDSNRAVTLNRPTIRTARSKPPSLTALATKGAALDDAHDLRFATPFKAPLAAIGLRGSDADGVIPVQLFGRDAEEQPWQFLAAATLRPGKTARLDLGGSGLGQYRIEADKRSAGFSAAPAIELMLAPVELVVAFNGEQPYRLTLGDAQEQPRFFQPGDIIEPNTRVGTLPLAKVESATAPVISLGAGAHDSPFAPRKLALWGALLLATVVLALGATRMLKANVATAQE
jgi:hypothetical protein